MWGRDDRALTAQWAESRHPLNGGKPSADDPTQRNAASLAKTLSELEPILAAIHTAMASRLDAPAVANGWQRLFVAAKSITKQLAR